MAQEIEIKLSLDPADIEKINTHPLLRDLPVRSQMLQNTYYDTPALVLHARRMAVRFRKKGDVWLLTVKTAESSRDGLAIRNEWEVAAEPGVFDFSHVDEPEIRRFLETHKAQLKPVFSTDFTRQIRIVQHRTARIELATDQGHIECKGQREKLCEIELELLDGQIADLKALASELQRTLPLSTCDNSKAARGYRTYLASKT